ncbi:P-loop containing nucleoside triphosphate hydrolase protein [Syncephalis fuscata]|nr:P-loop containing nucleoside triphosphate hydrolase protein [Syncephalis fuscata]
MLVDVSRGIHCNLKIVIRGAQKTGKSTLFHRVQGLPFSDQYTPTPQIQVENIQWNYNDHQSNVIKVEFWDVVDHGIVTEEIHQDNDPHRNMMSSLLLDAETVDVYRGANAVVLMYDVTREETLDYVKQHLPNIPHGIPILILANFCDKTEDRIIERDHVMEWLSDFEEEKSPASDFVFEFIRYTEASLKNGQGLDYLHRFLGVPFLASQVDTLRRQLTTRAEELGQLLASLDASKVTREHKSIDSNNNDNKQDKHKDSNPLTLENGWDDTTTTTQMKSPITFNSGTSLANYPSNGHANHMTEQELAHRKKRRQRQGAMLKHLSHAKWDDDDEEDEDEDEEEDVYDNRHGHSYLEKSYSGKLSISPLTSTSTTSTSTTTKQTSHHHVQQSWISPNHTSNTIIGAMHHSNRYYNDDDEDYGGNAYPNPLVAADEDIDEDEERERDIRQDHYTNTQYLLTASNITESISNTIENEVATVHLSQSEYQSSSLFILNKEEEEEEEEEEEKDDNRNNEIDYKIQENENHSMYFNIGSPLESDIDYGMSEHTTITTQEYRDTTSHSTNHLSFSTDYTPSPALSDTFEDNSNPWASHDV